MDRLINKLRTEPVRVRLYGLAVLVATYLLSKGVVSVGDSQFVIAVAGLVLAVEGSRSKVAPMSKL